MGFKNCQELLSLVRLATGQEKNKNVFFLLEEKSAGKTIGITGLTKRFGIPFFFLAVSPGFQGKGILTGVTRGATPEGLQTFAATLQGTGLLTTYNT